MLLCIAQAEAQIVINSQFKARSFEEMAAPLIMAQKFQNECLEKLEVLSEETEEIESFINKEKDPVSWKMYADCYNSIIDVYNDIVRRGTNQGTRNTISSLRRASISVRNQIKTAYEKRAQLANDQYIRIKSIQGLICDKYYSDISLDCYLNGNTPEVKYIYPSKRDDTKR